jgi:hypothetical protein
VWGPFTGSAGAGRLVVGRPGLPALLGDGDLTVGRLRRRPRRSRGPSRPPAGEASR